MLTITALRLRNWKCYRGEQELRLEPRAYAVFAREEGNAERSNFLGKSSLAEAVDFALYGRLAEEFRSRKRGWISRGEKSGEVALELSDGSIIRRSMQLTGSERLWYFPPGSPEKGAMQEEAQKRIVELVGLTREDFTATRYFQQNEMNRLITMKPEPRLDMVCGWLRLERVQECEEDAAAALAELARRRDAAAARAEAARGEEAAAYARVGILQGGAEDPDAVLGRKIAAAEHALEGARAEAEAARAAVERESARAALVDAAAAYESAVAEGKRAAAALREFLLSLLADVPEKVSAAELKVAREILTSAHEEAQREAVRTAAVLRERDMVRGARADDAERRRRVLVSGFDGRCPVVGAECPSRAWVGEQREGARRAEKEARERAESAIAEASGARSDYERASRRSADALSRLKELDVHAHRVGLLRAEAARLLPSFRTWQEGVGECTGLEAARAAEAAAAEELRGVEGILRDAEACRAAVADARERGAAESAEAERLERAVRVAAAGVAVFGKNGAQRRLGEGPLAEIEEDACRMLARAGSPLSVSVEWGREGSGLAAACAACGHPFPRSEKVKRCERCGAERGPNLVHRLEIRPSNESGGARDLAGIFTQLAAAAWLVADRGSRWGTALLDEPLAALDAHHRRALAAHLPALLRESGVEQAVIIAHHDGFLDALPGRILVESRGGWSTARVVA